MRFYQVTTLPATLQPDSFYLVLNNTYCETYVTDDTGVAKLVGNTTMINELITTALASAGSFEFAPTIADRNNLALTANTMIYVNDASGDADVVSGAALYAYEHASTTFHLAAEYESLDQNIQLTWASITGSPSSTPAQIDSAVSNSHSHTNSALLDLLGGTGDDPTFSGNPVSTQNSNDW